MKAVTLPRLQRLISQLERDLLAAQLLNKHEVARLLGVDVRKVADLPIGKVLVGAKTHRWPLGKVLDFLNRRALT